jgi:glutamate formiminotransferase/formiminotetrahydrofolate cyclodeaminase
LCNFIEKNDKVMAKLIECVPNFSEGRDPEVIDKITSAIKSVAGIKLLDTCSGAGTNRTVVTFAGTPEDIIEAAYRGIEAASLNIDMSRQKGVHPRMGSTDVCPLVPVTGISMEETAEYARRLAERAGNELKIPVYCYEYAAFSDERRSLEKIRRGGYEGLKDKLSSPAGKPDFGPSEWSEKIRRAGAVIIGARNYLIAYNVNLATDSVEIARDIAAAIRESGSRKGESAGISEGEAGDDVHSQVRLKKVKAIGWYIEEYGCAQVSMNLTDFNITPVHVAFEEITRQAKMRGIEVTGSELIGLIPLKAITDAGRYYIKKSGLNEALTEKEVIDMAVKSLGLDSVQPFDATKRVIEYLIK